jgi:hypothetical protein
LDSFCRFFLECPSTGTILADFTSFAVAVTAGADLAFLAFGFSSASFWWQFADFGVVFTFVSAAGAISSPASSNFLGRPRFLCVGQWGLLG